MSARKNRNPKTKQKKLSRKQLKGESRKRLIELSQLVGIGLRHMLKDFFKKSREHINSHSPIAEEARKEVRDILGR